MRVPYLMHKVHEESRLSWSKIFFFASSCSFYFSFMPVNETVSRLSTHLIPYFILFLFILFLQIRIKIIIALNLCRLMLNMTRGKNIVVYVDISIIKGLCSSSSWHQRHLKYFLVKITKNLHDARWWIKIISIPWCTMAFGHLTLFRGSKLQFTDFSDLLLIS